MTSRIYPGDFHVMEVNNMLFAVHRDSNQIYDIDNVTYKYLNQEPSIFLYDQNIEKYINDAIQSDQSSKKQTQLFINISAKNIDSEFIILRELLNRSKDYSIIYLVFEVYDEIVDLVKKLTDWSSGNPKVHYIFRATNGKEYLLRYLKQWVKNQIDQKKVSFEVYKTIFNESVSEEKTLKHRIRISPFLLTQQVNDEDLLSIAKHSYFFDTLNTIYRKNYKLRDTDIITLSDVDFLSSTEKKEATCNFCWAKKNCHALNLYTMFSSHPSICSLSQRNCNIIRKLTEEAIIDNIQQNFIDKTAIIEYNIDNFKIIHLNP